MSTMIPHSILLSSKVAPEATVEAAVATEEAGFRRIWLTEDYYRKAGFASSAAVLASTRELAVGLGVTSLFLRHPTVLAMEIATLERMYVGRFEVGLAGGSPRALKSAERVATSIVTSTGDRLDVVRRLLSGAEVDWRDDFDRVTEARLEYLPKVPSTIWMAAEGPRMLATAAARADGVVFSVFSTPEYLRWARETLDAEAHVPTVLYLHVSLDEDRSAAARAARGLVVERLRAGYRASSMERSGHWDRVQSLLGASKETIEAGIDEDLVADFVLFGDAAECREKLAAFAACVDETALSPVAPEQNIAAAISAVGATLLGT